MNIGINNFNNEDLKELSKVWYNLSDNMREIIAEALGEKHNLSTLESIMYGFIQDSIVKCDNTDISVVEIKENNKVLTAEQVEMFRTLAENLTLFNEYFKNSIDDIKKLDDAFVNLKKTTDK